MTTSAYHLYAFESEKWRKAIETNYCTTEQPAGITEVVNGRVLPLRTIEGTSAIFGDGLMEGGVATEDGDFVAGQFRSTRKPRHNRSCIQSYDVEGERLVKRDETVIFGGILVRHWGHMLVDATSRLWYPLRHPELPYKVVFVMFPKQTFPYEKLLSLAGLDPSRYEIIIEPTQFSKVIVPDETSFSGTGQYRREWLAFFDAARDGVDPMPYEKIYLTRTAFEINNVVGEEYFERYFEKRGYKVFSPEKLSVKDQVRMIAGAKDIVTTMGTISHLALFAHEGTKLTVLSRSKDVVRQQLAIGQVRGVETYYVDAYLNFLPEHQAGNCIYLLGPNENWNAYIADRFGDVPDESFESDVLPFTSLEYIKKWGAFFNSATNFRWIRNTRLADVAQMINGRLNHDPIDASDFPEPVAIERIRYELEDRRSDSLLTVRAEGALVEEGDVILSGKVKVPFCDPDQMGMSMRLVQGHEDVLPCGLSFGHVGEGTFEWAATAGVADLLGALDKTGSSAPCRFMMTLSNGTTSRELPVVVDPRQAKGYPKSYLGLCADDLRTAYLACEERGTRLEIVQPNTSEALAVIPVEACIDELLWEGDVVSASGTLSSPIAGSDGLESCRLVALAYGSEDESEPIAFDTDFEKVSKDVSRWSFTADAQRLVKASEACEADLLRWDFYLELVFDGSTRMVRIGENHAEGLDEKYLSRGLLSTDGGRFHIPVETGKENISLEAPRYESLLKRCWFEGMCWEDGFLRMHGSITTPAAREKDVSIWLSIRVRDDESPMERLAKLQTEIGVSVNTLKWKVEVPRADIERFILSNLPSTTDERFYDICFDYELAGIRREVRVGSKRRPGTWNKFRTVFAEDTRQPAVSHQDKNGDMGFAVMRADESKAGLKRKLKNILGRK